MNERGWTWNDKAERLPTETDAEFGRCVMVWDTLNGTRIANWHDVERVDHIIAWAHMPPAPEWYKKEVRKD